MSRRTAASAGTVTVLAAGAVLAACARGQAPPAPPAPPPGAVANAILKTELPCYLPDQTVQIAGRGYRPSATYSVILDRAALGPGTARADGTIAGSLSSGALAPRAHEIRHRLQVTDGANIGRAAFSTTAFDAEFSPSAGNPRTLRVSFSVYGIGLGHSGPATVYVHYLDPRGHLLATAAIGRTAGACGDVRNARARPLFPFHHVAAGTWTLQFDTNRSYSSANKPRIARSVAVGA